jgi:branched-chain amino acid transport system permease protein
MAHSSYGELISPGAVIGAFIVTFAAELLRPLETYRYVIFGAAVVLSVLFMPQGIMGILEPAKRFVSRTFKRRRAEEAPKT